jgi:hypothetical protein
MRTSSIARPGVSIRRGADRHQTRIGWLHGRHSFDTGIDPLGSVVVGTTAMWHRGGCAGWFPGECEAREASAPAADARQRLRLGLRLALLSRG